MLNKLPRPVFMADISRAMNTPPPAAQQPQATPPADNRPPRVADERVRTVQPGYDPVGEADAKRDAKNERDRLRRKAKRAAAVKAAAEADATATKLKIKRNKKKKAKKKKVAAAPPQILGKRGVKRRRGRPPGAKNKPKADVAIALVPAPGALPHIEAHGNALIAQINSAVLLLNAMPEHARKVVLDAVK